MTEHDATSDSARRIGAFIDALAGRHQRISRLAWATRAALVVGLVWLAMLALWYVASRWSSVAPLLVVFAALAASAAYLVRAWRRQPAAVSRTSLARLAEDHLGGLDDRLVTSVDAVERRSPSPMSALLLDDTARRLSDDDVELVIPTSRVRGATWRAAVALGALAVLAFLGREPVGQATRAVGLWAFPARLALDVSPGDARVKPGVPFVVKATTSDAARGLVPEITVTMQDASRSARMKAESASQYAFGFESVPRSFGYRVAVAGHQSRQYEVTLLEAPRVAQIDLAYAYPAFTKMAPRTETNGGDIYAPEGSRVTLRVTPKTTTAPIASAAIVFKDGKELPMAVDGEQLVGTIDVAADTAYRIRLRDADGLDNADDPEYYVRRLDDRPPDVRIVRPAGDKRVTPLEEVTIEARADDDHGLERLELVIGVRGQKETAVPIGEGGGLTMTGRHTVYLEDLDVAPGDFISFYARARDVARGKRPTESRSDMFFLEVTPYVDEFAMAQSQAAAGAAGQQVDDFVRQQKDLISATWKLQRRAAGANERPSSADVKTLARGQAALRKKVEAAARQTQMLGPRRRPNAVVGASDETPPALLSAARAMATAEQLLDAVKPSEALPPEMEALNHLLRAEAEIQRREIARQQANAGGGGANRNQQDLSTLFDRELQRQQETNYETPQSVEQRQTDQRDELLERVRELARRQEALARQQADLARDRAQMDQEEVRRRLERLTRDQTELRRQAEQLAQQMQQQAAQQRREGQQGQKRQSQGQQSQGQSQGESEGRQASGQRGSQSGSQPGSAAQAGAEALREASEDMRAAASDLRREAPDQARDRSARALDRLNAAERGLREAGPDEQRRAAGDAQLDARQLADRQRQLAEQTARLGAKGSEDARRRLAGEQQRLGERADALDQRVKQLADAPTGDRASRERMAGAARAAEKARVGDKMRAAADQVRRGDAKVSDGESQRAIARQLDQLADAVSGTPAAGQDQEGRQLADDLSKAKQLREHLSDLQRQIEKAGTDPSQAGDRSARGSRGQPRGEGEQGRRLAELQREYLETLREAGDLGQQLQQASPGSGRAMSTPVDQQMVASAPGTQAFKQDFAKWESLHKEIALGLEKLEAALSQRVVERAARERLRTGGVDRVPDGYRATVERYYRALAEEPR